MKEMAVRREEKASRRKDDCARKVGVGRHRGRAVTVKERDVVREIEVTS